MKTAKYEMVKNELIDNGWIFSHSALARGYNYSGSIAPMKTKKGFQYCRLYTSQTVKAGKYQITYVFKKAIA